MVLGSSFPEACYDIGGTALGIEARDAEWQGYLDRRWSSFRDRSEPRFTVRYRTTAPVPATLVSPFQVHHEPCTVRGDRDGFEIVGSTFRARADLGARRAEVEGPRALYPFDTLLRHLLPSLVEDGAVFHGAAFRLGERGFVAAGDSGRGKSTLARLLGDAALCDEWAAVRGIGGGDAAGPGAPRVAALPINQARRGDAELAGILLLHHGRRRHTLRRRTAPEAVRSLSAVTLWPLHLTGETGRLLGRLVALVERVPVWDFAFLPRGDVGSFLQREIG